MSGGDVVQQFFVLQSGTFQALFFAELFAIVCLKSQMQQILSFNHIKVNNLTIFKSSAE